ncbi:MAG: tetratricopeptide repeat protein [Deltaproteobacteria bacterium]|nr:MAG: tetratricopeptide repeat protein [Deltaproteobacteria bacterium]
MRVFLYFMVAVLLFSCGGAPTKKKKSMDFDYKEKPKVSKRYNALNDRYAYSKGNKDALIQESMARAQSKILRRVAGDDDPISRLIGNCYKKDFNEAFEVADKYYESYKKNPAYWNQIGSCYLLRGEQKKALIYYNTARSLNPRYAPAINNLGVIYERRGEDEQALIKFKKAMRLNYAANTPRFNQANLYLKYGLHQKACPLFLGLDKEAPGDPDVVNALGVCNLLKGRYKSAAIKFAELDRDHFETPYIGINYALALQLSGKRSEAEDIIDDIDSGKLGNLKRYHQMVKNYISRGRR